MNSLFGAELPTSVNFVIAFVAVLVLIGAATWLVRRFGATRLDAAARGRQPRLAVLDSAAVDGRRRLVIIRRDNVEHLLMIGGPTDVVVETNIVRAPVSASREAPSLRNGGPEPVLRATPIADPWPLQPEPSPAPVAPMRAERPPRVVVDETQWQAPIEPGPPPHHAQANRPSDQLAGLAAELSRPGFDRPGPDRAGPDRAAAPHPAYPEPDYEQPPPQAAPPASPAPPGAPVAQMPDQSLAEMAQRLEAALRRPAMQRNAPAAEPQSAPRAEPKAAAAQGRGGAHAKSPQSADLEREMASLLHRPGKP
jgi:hypothetical protein